MLDNPSPETEAACRSLINKLQHCKHPSKRFPAFLTEMVFLGDESITVISVCALVFGAASPATLELTQRFEDVIFVTVEQAD